MTARARGFVESTGYLIYTLAVCIPAFPRWAYAQELSSTKSDREPSVLIAFRK